MTDPTRRRRDLAAIHVTSKKLGLSEDERRDVIYALTNHRSCSELDYTQLQRVRAHFAQRLRASEGDRAPGPVAGMARDPMSRKIRALWLTLAENGKVADRSESALLAFVRRQTGVDRLEWCSKEQKDQVIEALKAWTKR